MAAHPRVITTLKFAVFLLALLPAATLMLGAVRNTLGAEPVESLLHGTGDWALRFLLITLAVTPLRHLTGWVDVVRFRRMLGLFAFFYASCHFGIYLILDQQLWWSGILQDIVKRPYITVGFSALLLMVPLAVTSTRGWMRRLGRRWKQLHRLVYVSAVGGVLHFLWLVKADVTEPAVYAAILGVLFLLRWTPVRRGLSGLMHSVRQLPQQG